MDGEVAIPISRPISGQASRCCRGSRHPAAVGLPSAGARRWLQSIGPLGARQLFCEGNSMVLHAKPAVVCSHVNDIYIILYIYIYLANYSNNNSHLVASSWIRLCVTFYLALLIRFGELLGSYFCPTDHVGALLFLANQYVNNTFSQADKFIPL